MKNRKISEFKLKCNHIIFWWYYKRVPNFFHSWPILKSIKLLKDNYEHALSREEGLNEVIGKAIKGETELKDEITTLRFKMHGITQDKLDPINKAFGTKLKGKSTQERDN